MTIKFLLVALFLSVLASPALAQQYRVPAEDVLRPVIQSEVALPDPMEGLSLAGRRAHCAFGIILFLELAGISAIAFAEGNNGLGAGLVSGSGLALGLGIWGGIRLRARRIERKRHWELLPPHIAMQQRDVRLVGPRTMIGIGSVFLAASAGIPASIFLQSEDPTVLLFGLPYLVIGSLLLGLGIRRTRERRHMRARFTGNGVTW